MTTPPAASLQESLERLLRHAYSLGQDHGWHKNSEYDSDREEAKRFQTEFEEFVADTLATAQPRLKSDRDLEKKMRKDADDRLTVMQQERDAAFAMSRCECLSSEACGWLVKAQQERDELRAALRQADSVLRVIEEQDPVENVLDPQWAARIARSARPAIRSSLTPKEPK
jgi:hypothetical protein